MAWLFATQPQQSSCRLLFLRSLGFILNSWFGLIAFTLGVSGQSSTTTIEGIVRYQPDSGEPWRFQRYYVADANTGALAETVVVLTPKAKNETSTTKTVEQPIVMDQENFQFVPETIAVQTGTKVTFTNSDDSLHNVMLAKSKDAFNVNLGKDEVYEHVFQQAVDPLSPHQLGCVYHGSMRAWVFVVDHPYFFMTRKDGRFRIAHVPHGDYELVVHHPAGKLIHRQQIRIPETSEPLEIKLSPQNLRSKMKRD